MREILFKGKRIDNGEWIEGGYSEHEGKTFIVVWKRYIPDTRDWGTIEYYENNLHYNSVLIEVDPETVCQYTGMTDKNGRKIFDGDIVKDDSIRLKGGIKFSERYLQFMVDDINDGEQDYAEFMEKVEVIGNIFDNSELLKEDSENANPAN